jgi:Fe-S cluster assembly iron-binding protein IscA
MSNLSLGSTYSNARASLVTATGKGGKGSGGGLQGDVNITLPNIAVDVDWNLTKNQGATLAIKNKPTIATGDFYQSTNNPFTKLNGIPTGAKIGYVEAGTLDCDGRLAANNISTNLVDTDKLHATSVASITDSDGQPLFATVAATGQYTDLLSKPALSTVATTGKYTDLSSKPTLSTVAATGNYTDLLSKPTFSIVATSGNYTDLSNAPPQLGDVELQLQTIPTCVDWNLTSNQGSALAIINKPVISGNNANLATVATTGNYTDLTNKPILATVAATGNYADLVGKPASATPVRFSVKLIMTGCSGYTNTSQYTNIISESGNVFRNVTWTDLPYYSSNVPAYTYTSDYSTFTIPVAGVYKIDWTLCLGTNANLVQAFLTSFDNQTFFPQNPIPVAGSSRLIMPTCALGIQYYTWTGYLPQGNTFQFQFENNNTGQTCQCNNTYTTFTLTLLQ